MMLENLKGNISRDMKDCCDLFDFVTEKHRSPSEIDGVINGFAHQKYSFGKTQKGHDLRVQYKNWLRYKLRQMLRDYYKRKLREPNGLNNSK